MFVVPIKQSQGFFAVVRMGFGLPDARALQPMKPR